MKKLFTLFAFVAIAMSAMAEDPRPEEITIQGTLVRVPIFCLEEVCPTCEALAIATTDKIYHIKDQDCDSHLKVTIDGVEYVFEEGDEVIATGVITTHIDFLGEEKYLLDITSIQPAEKQIKTLTGQIVFADVPCMSSPCIHDWTCEPETPCPDPAVALALYAENGEDSKKKEYYITNTYTTQVLDGTRTITLLDTQIKEGATVVLKGEVTKYIDIHNYLFYHINVESIGAGEETSLEEVQADPIGVRKVIENGQVIFIRDGVRYNVLGARL